ncbi:MAG TPA: isochorismatase family cysteine hydrolase [Phenylobacterium sp.]|uniref:isochorismatase family cysteine hydrolase n=1 Tax=Phenylobacterium sp. TaxID=1871053 RepID=UPI002B45D283|nr:isochorismatase family cysteine hydrolase [Phenylobacterium sp.]HKR89315.1 isochorismatase family cysteine hydrolase [Phenylobacterium sp.]
MHEISISQQLVDAIVSRLGRLPRHVTLDASKTALVVIDMQNVFMLPGMPVEVPAAREIVPNINRLAAAMREAGGKVIWVKMTLEGQSNVWSVLFDCDPNPAAFEQMMPGSHGFELHADLDVRPEDIILEKNRFSAFIQGASDIDRVLRAAGIDTIVVTGTLTNICCESSARDAMMLNYKVVLVSDANAAITDAEHNAALNTVLFAFGDVPTTDDVIGRLTSSKSGRVRADATSGALI